MNPRQYTKEELRTKYSQLPEEIKEALNSDSLIDTIEKASSKFKIHIDQRGELASEIGLVLLGVTRPNEFLNNVQERLKISLEMAGEIVKDVNQGVFFPIRASLEKINNGGVASYRPEQATKVENFSPAGNVSNSNIKQDETPLSTPGNNAIIVGNIAPHNDDSGDKKLFEEKMGKLFRLPKEEVELGATENDSDSVSPKKGVDPYHEAIN